MIVAFMAAPNRSGALINLTQRPYFFHANQQEVPGPQRLLALRGWGQNSHRDGGAKGPRKFCMKIYEPYPATQTFREKAEDGFFRSDDGSWLASALMKRDEITIRQPTRARLLRAERYLTANYCYCDAAARATLIFVHELG